MLLIVPKDFHRQNSSKGTRNQVATTVMGTDPCCSCSGARIADVELVLLVSGRDQFGRGDHHSQEEHKTGPTIRSFAQQFDFEVDNFLRLAPREEHCASWAFHLASCSKSVWSDPDAFALDTWRSWPSSPSASGSRAGLSCLFCMVQNVCNARPSIKDFCMASRCLLRMTNARPAWRKIYLSRW